MKKNLIEANVQSTPMKYYGGKFDSRESSPESNCSPNTLPRSDYNCLWASHEEFHICIPDYICKIYICKTNFQRFTNVNFTNIISTAAPTHPPGRRWIILPIPKVYWLAYEDFTFVKFTAVTPSGLYCRQFYKYKINEEINGRRKQRYHLVFPLLSGFYLSSSLGAPISPSVQIKEFRYPPPDPPEGGRLLRPRYARPPRALATLAPDIFAIPERKSQVFAWRSKIGFRSIAKTCRDG